MARYDFVVLGSGPAGRRAAIQAAKLGRSVLVVDDRTKVGGVSVHTGTIPSKTLRETALNLSGWRERGFYGRSYRAKESIAAADLSTRMEKTFAFEVSVLEHQFARNGVEVCVGRGRFAGPSRECLALPVARRLRSEDVLAALAELFVNRGPPAHIRSDNGPEFIANAV